MRYKNPFIRFPFLKKSVFDEIGGYDENYKYAQDYKFFIDTKLKGYKILQLTSLYYLNTKNNISNNYYEEQMYYLKKASKYYVENK